MPVAADTRLDRAAVYQLLAVGYGYPSPGQRRRMQALAQAPAGDGASWTAAVAALRVRSAAARQDTIEADFNRLFSGKVECPPHETAYEPDVFRRQRALADVVGFYRAFSFELDGDSRWQPDHVGVELEFCSLLLQREAHALAEGWDDPAQVCEHALRAFLVDHLGRWYAAFSRQLARRAATALYRDLAEATDRWLAAEIRALGLRPEPLAARPRSTEDDAPPVCGGSILRNQHGQALRP